MLYFLLANSLLLTFCEVILSVLYNGAFMVIKNYTWCCFYGFVIESKPFLFNNVKNLIT